MENDDVDQQNGLVASAVDSPKRGRGRPAKGAAVVKKAVGAKTGGGRGRPRKEPQPAQNGSGSDEGAEEGDSSGEEDDHDEGSPVTKRARAPAENGEKKARGCPKGGWPGRPKSGKPSGPYVPTGRPRGCPKGGWPSKK